MVSSQVWGRVGLALGFLGVAACASVLGIEDRTLDTSLDSGTTNDSAGGDTKGDTASTDGPMADAGPCGDVQTSATNCGRCGHSCLGGACTAGVCQPVALVSMIKPWDIHVDTSSVYWTEPYDGYVMKADKTTGANPVALMSASSSNSRIFFPFYIALDGTSVFLADEGTGYILSCPTTGCGGNPTTVGVLDAGEATAHEIAVDSTYVYWTDTTDSVWRAPKSGAGPVQHLATYSPELEGGVASVPEAIAVDSTFVFFTNDDGTIQKVALAGGTPTLFAAGPVQIAGQIAIANNSVYFTQNNDPGTVESVPTSGGTATVLQGSQHLPAGVVADGNNIYWVNQGTAPSLNDGTVMMCPLTNCSVPTTLATGQLGPVGIAVDENAVYWTDPAVVTTGSGTGEMGAVMMVAKP